MAPKRQASGGARMRSAGKTPLLLGLTPEQREKISSAAEIKGVPMTQVMLTGGLAYAERIIQKKA